MEDVWNSWTGAEHIRHWYFASEDWHVPFAENDLREGGKFRTTMASKDGKMGFEFEGTYFTVSEHEMIGYELADGRKVITRFSEAPEGIYMEESFDPETENPIDMQSAGWQAILNQFKKYTERNWFH